MRVYLLEGNLPVYESMRKYPPEGVEYVAPISGDIKNYYSGRLWRLRRIVSTLNRVVGIPRMLPLETNADVIHTNRGILTLSKTPCVMDLDYLTAFTSFDPRPLRNWHTRAIILRFLSSPRCAAILSWSEIAQTALRNYISGSRAENVIGEKMGVLYPAFPPHEHHGTNEPPVVLFSASLFRAKGGPEFLEAAKRLSERYDVRFVVKADVPSEYRRKYALPNVEYYPYKSEVLPHDEYVDRYFARADIYVYPTFLDIFGLGILDAFSVGIPVISTDIFAVPEMVVDGETGLLFHVPEKYRWHDSSGFWNPLFSLPDEPMEWAVAALVEKISSLIEDSQLRKVMGRRALREVRSGKFSISRRNVILRDAYESALHR